MKKTKDNVTFEINSKRRAEMKELNTTLIRDAERRWEREDRWET